jgi:hypothetical protein
MRTCSLLAWLPLLAFLATPAAPQARKDVPVELVPYLGTVTLMDYSIQEVLAAYPELKGLEFSQTQEELAPLLQKVGEAVQALFADLPSTSSLERISQERTEPGQTEQLYLQRDYHYLVSPQKNIADVGFEEYRSELKNEHFKPEESKGSLFLSSGYATHPIYFHPQQQSGSRYRYLGRHKSERNAYVIAFAQRPESAGTLRYLSADNQTIAILLQGLAWIDPDTYKIIRMRSDLLAPRKDISLEFQTTSIRFGEVKFKGIARGFWLPLEVVVATKYQGYFFRNRHRYSQYRLFTVEAQDGPIVPIKP